jgi:hypothetical protein
MAMAQTDADINDNITPDALQVERDATLNPVIPHPSPCHGRPRDSVWPPTCTRMVVVLCLGELASTALLEPGQLGPCSSMKVHTHGASFQLWTRTWTCTEIITGEAKMVYLPINMLADVGD